MTTPDLERDIGAVIARHADLLTGPEFLRAAERCAHGYFDDCKDMLIFDGQKFFATLAQELSDAEERAIAQNMTLIYKDSL